MSAEGMDTNDVVYKTLLESTKAIPWRVDWETMEFSYIGPQIQALLGWTPQSWMSIDDWADRIHPDDRERVVHFCISQSQAGVDHEADYRALTKDGGYVWIRDVVHVIRKSNGEVDALVGFMFDISERKATEEAVTQLQKKLEELSYQDGLTGVANRRMFDSVLEKEWASARRGIQPLSLIMLDIDYFKEFNDHYGHVAGDDCLRRVGRVLERVAARPRDFVARFGGEEFALILPETDARSADQVAEKCRQMIYDEMIPHDSSSVSPFLTISLGVGTLIPTQTNMTKAFIESVDRRLYKAKQRGRNCVQFAQQENI